MKTTLIVLALLFVNITFAQTKLLLIGGGKRPELAMETFSKLCNGNRGLILIVPWASDSIQGAENIKNQILSHSQANVQILSQTISSIEAKAKIQNAAGIFFAGGDQNKLMDKILELDLSQILKTSYLKGVIFAGTSAGTAIMSETMLTGTSDLSVIDAAKTETTLGLGLLPSGIIVDQHFIVRSRFNRLAGIVLNKDNTLGIGIDENTALLVLDNKTAEVIGPTQVLFMKSNSKKSMEVKVLSSQDVYKF